MDSKKFLNKFWDKTIPVDIFAIAQKAGVDLAPDWEPNAPSGRCFWENNKPFIRYNGSEHIVRQRFTIAHELGHLFLNHGSKFRDTPEEYRISAYDPLETEANQFAAEVLMPNIAIEYLIKKKDIYSPDEMAKRLNVSEIAMKYRLKNLGWIS